MAEKTEVASRIKNVAIAGAGGIGAYLAGFLYDLGVNRNQFPFNDWTWHVYDSDIIESGNLLHQNFTEDDLGRNKAEVVAERSVGGFKPVLEFMTAKDLPKYDVVFSCVDSMTFRKELYEYSWDHPSLYWIDGRCSSRNIGLYNSKVSQKILKTALSDSQERKGCLLLQDKEKKKGHITPVVVASMMAQCFLNHLRGEDTQDEILLYL